MSLAKSTLFHLAGRTDALAAEMADMAEAGNMAASDAARARMFAAAYELGEHAQHLCDHEHITHCLNRAECARAKHNQESAR